MAASPTTDRHRTELSWPPTRTQAALGALGLVAGIGAAVYTYDRYPSWWLALYVFGSVAGTIGGSIPHVIARPNKLQRSIYVGLLPVVSAALVCAAYWAWDRMWLAVLIGVFLGGTVHRMLARALFPRIGASEANERSGKKGVDQWAT